MKFLEEHRKIRCAEGAGRNFKSEGKRQINNEDSDAIIKHKFIRIYC